MVHYDDQDVDLLFVSESVHQRVLAERNNTISTPFTGTVFFDSRIPLDGSSLDARVLIEDTSISLHPLVKGEFDRFLPRHVLHNLSQPTRVQSILLSPAYVNMAIPFPEFPNLHIHPERYQELDSLVHTLSGIHIGDVVLLRTHHNTTHHLYLENGWHGILKEYADPHAAHVEHAHTTTLAEVGLAPRTFQEGRVLLSTHLQGRHLSSLRTDDPTLAMAYNRAIDILVALDERTPLCNRPRSIDQQFYLEKCGEESDPTITSRQATIPLDYYPVHVLVNPDGRAMAIDFEHVAKGPIEFALATLLVNVYHDLSEEFIRDQLQYYIAKRPETNIPLLSLAFHYNAHLVERRVSSYIQRREQVGEHVHVPRKIALPSRPLILE